MAKAKKTMAQEHSNFLMLAYCELLLRGFDRERDIADPILRKVWRLGKRIKELKVPRTRGQALDAATDRLNEPWILLSQGRMAALRGNRKRVARDGTMLTFE